MVNFDVPSENNVFDSDEKNALNDKVKFLEHDCCVKDKLICSKRMNQIIYKNLVDQRVY